MLLTTWLRSAVQRVEEHFRCSIVVIRNVVVNEIGRGKGDSVRMKQPNFSRPQHLILVSALVNGAVPCGAEMTNLKPSRLADMNFAEAPEQIQMFLRRFACRKRMTRQQPPGVQLCKAGGVSSGIGIARKIGEKRHRTSRPPTSRAWPSRSSSSVSRQLCWPYADQTGIAAAR